MSDISSADGPRKPVPAPATPEPERQAPRVYFRTTYPLNPGIPHHLDFPRGWK